MVESAFGRDDWPDDDRLRPARPDLAAAHLRDTVTATDYTTGRAGQVVAGWTALRDRPARDGARLTELLYGEAFAVYESKAGWVWGQSLTDGYVGYAEASALSDRTVGTTHQVVSAFSHLYAEPAIKSPAETILPFGARLAVHGRANTEFLATDFGYVPARHVAEIGNFAADPLSVAGRFRGAPYLWGGRTAAGLDCSALVQLAVAACGLDVPRDTDLQERYLRSAPFADEVAEADSRPGDLIYFPGHVGFLMDGGRILHATGTLIDCRIEPLEHLLDRVRADHAVAITGIFRLRRPAAEGDGPSG